MAPGVRLIRGLKPESARAEGDPSSAQVADAEPAELQWHADAVPIDRAVSNSRIFPSMPHEFADEAVDQLEDVGVEGNSR